MRFLPAALALASCAWAQLPDRPDSFRFGVIGDSGTGGPHQYEVGKRIAEFHKKVSFETVVMLGDNLYGRQQPRDFKTKFELPYKPLLDSGVKFYAALGNHDVAGQESYEPFHMGGRRYYTFQPRAGIRFFMLDSSGMDPSQLDWLQAELRRAGEDGKIVCLHHPLYSSGRKHGSSPLLRAALEPLFVKYGVSVVLAGHDHFYERIKPQKGIHHFVAGGSAKLRAGNVRRDELTAAFFDRDNSFVVMEIAGDKLYFQAISRPGETVDSGSFAWPAMPRVSASVGVE